MRYPCPADCGVDSWSKVELADHARLTGHGLPEELADRRQRAREAAYGAPVASTVARRSRIVSTMISEAIETATRVQLTREVFDAFFAEGPTGDPDNPNWREPLAAAFRAAGFEVEE